jgi:myo-inositol-1-phosphate synthase
MSKIRLAIVGVGNCASSLLQGLEHYQHASVSEQEKPVGLMHYDLGGYRPADIEVACAFDIDARKVATNIVVFDVSGTGRVSAEISARLKARGVLINGINERQMRAVTHYDVTRAECAQALAAMEEAARGLP